MDNLLNIINILDNKIFIIYSKKTFLMYNNMYNNMYIYTLNDYKAYLIKQIPNDIQVSYSQYCFTENNIKDMIIKFLQLKINNYYLPDIFTNIKYLNSIQHIEQKSQEWLDIRKNIIPASESGYLLGVKGVGVMMNYISNKVGLPSTQDLLKNMLSIQHGNIFEDVSRIIYETRHNVIVKEYGLIKSKKNSMLSASPDGVVINANDNVDNVDNIPNCRIGRLLEIKNPFTYDASDDIKPEYMIQMQQQMYVLESPLCDFIKTNIVGLNVNKETIKNGFTSYKTLDDMLNDKYIDNALKIHNKNIPTINLNSRGMEKGLLISYKDMTTGNIKIILYSIKIEYVKDAIINWICTTKSELNKNGNNANSIHIQYWYIANYFEKTILYDEKLFEKNYIIRLQLIWNLITYIKNISDLQQRAHFISYTLRAHFNKPSAYYKTNDNFKSICSLLTQSLQLKPCSEDDYITYVQSQLNNLTIKTNNKNNKQIIELDF